MSFCRRRIQRKKHRNRSLDPHHDDEQRKMPSQIIPHPYIKNDCEKDVMSPINRPSKEDTRTTNKFDEVTDIPSQSLCIELKNLRVMMILLHGEYTMLVMLVDAEPKPFNILRRTLWRVNVHMIAELVVVLMEDWTSGVVNQH